MFKLLNLNFLPASVMVLFRKKLGSKFLKIGHLYYVQLSVIQMLNPVLMATLKSLKAVAFGNSLSLCNCIKFSLYYNMQYPGFGRAFSDKVTSFISALLL
jgi:hypothetical protein